MTSNQAGLKQQADSLYERYGRPLEAEHWGEFVAISEDGKTLLGDNFEEVVRRARIAIGPGNFVFKIGEIAVGHWRRPSVKLVHDFHT